jgi:REP element-mobilizing transposase RayT
MPRRPRIFVEGGIYHVYNRFARGAELFAVPEEAERFLGLLRKVKNRDGLTVFAWCLMSNHYHLAVRSGPVPLSRTMGYVQALFGQAYNRRHQSSGPRWQSRYRARMVEDSRYLSQLIAYVHLNPVSANIVDDPAEYRYSGHREVIRKTADPLTDVEQTLGIYGDTLRASRRHYVRALKGARESEWKGEVPGRLPWWSREPDRPLKDVEPAVWIDERGLSSGRARKKLSAEKFLAATCRLLDQDLAALAGGGYARKETRDRILLAALGVERWRQKPRELGKALGKRADVVSRWVRWGAERRQEESEFCQAYEELDRRLSETVGE